jgi:hypothetical protein
MGTILEEDHLSSPSVNLNSKINLQIDKEDELASPSSLNTSASSHDSSLRSGSQQSAGSEACEQQGLTPGATQCLEGGVPTKLNNIEKNLSLMTSANLSTK